VDTKKWLNYDSQFTAFLTEIEITGCTSQNERTIKLLVSNPANFKDKGVPVFN
jgi:hypothetical protein